MTEWDPVAGRPAALTANSKCGDNRFVGIENFLEFYLDSNDCEITVRPKDSIATKVRMEWTMSEFYGDGGTTRFVDRMAAALGIDRSRIKVMSVYEGSVIVDFFIDALFSSDDGNGNAVINELDELLQQIVDVVAIVDLGAPVLGLEGDNVLLLGDPIPGAGAGAGGFNTAARREDNIWDRYVRIQEIMLKQREENKGTNLDFEKSKEEIEADKAAGIVYANQTVIRTNNTYKFSILVAAILVFIALIVTGICLMRCMTRSREEIHAVMKA